MEQQRPTRPIQSSSESIIFMDVANSEESLNGGEKIEKDQNGLILYPSNLKLGRIIGTQR